MRSSEQVNELATALAKAQGAMGVAIKDRTGQVGQQRTRYADLAAVVDAIKEPLSSNGLSYMQVLGDKEGKIGVETILMHRSGQWISGGILYLPVDKATSPQAHGSALTYARRYSLMATVGIPADDDDGRAAETAQRTHQSVASEIPVTQYPEEKFMENLKAWLEKSIPVESVKGKLKSQGFALNTSQELLFNALSRARLAGDNDRLTAVLDESLYQEMSPEHLAIFESFIERLVADLNQ